MSPLGTGKEIPVSKYNSLWEWIKDNNSDNFSLLFDEIEKIAGVPVDHSFLTYKKEMQEYGYRVVKISMKNKEISFEKIK